MPDAINTIASYRPDQAEQSAKFREWHVQALLNQSADLIATCLDDLREYRSLDFTWHLFRLALADETSTVTLERTREQNGYYGRPQEVSDRRLRYYAESDRDFAALTAEAQQLYEYRANVAEGNVGWTRHGVTNQQHRVEIHNRASERAITEMESRWAGLDAVHYRNRLSDRERTLLEKQRLTESGQPLALAWQRDFVLERLTRSYRDALNRADVAERGLRQVYGYAPSGAALPDPSTPGEAAISHVANWVRNAVEWLVAYEQRDQAFSRVISLASVDPQRRWQSARDDYRMQFHIGEEFFGNYHNVRLRGLSVCLVGNAGTVPWLVNLLVPRNGVYRRAEGLASVDQSDMPGCLLGRVESRNSHRPPDVCGMMSLMNASPAGLDGEDGSWTIELFRPTGSSEEFRDVDDVLVEMNTVGVPV